MHGYTETIRFVGMVVVMATAPALARPGASSVQTVTNPQTRFESMHAALRTGHDQADNDNRRVNVRAMTWSNCGNVKTQMYATLGH